jgi:AraC-like DNA-binding protein
VSSAKTYQAWKGFERAPRGRLLTQVVKISGPMGMAYERSVGFTKDFHVHDRDMLVCPRGASVMRVGTRGEHSQTFKIDAGDVLFVPKTCEHEDASLSAVYDTFALYPTDELLTECVANLGVTRREAQSLLKQPFTVVRTAWFTQILERYFAIRMLASSEPSARGAFLEHELVTEMLRCATARHDDPPSEASPQLEGEPGDAFTRALRYLEANLFQKVELVALAKHSGASISTLLRCFRKEVGSTPHAYVKARRLDEAKRLLKSGTAQVKVVALLVGYADVPSFSHAYKLHFGISPKHDTP